MRTFLAILRHVWQAHPFSATAFACRGVLIALVFGVSELLGLREYTTFLSGTSANPNISWEASAVLGLVHLLLYVAFLLLTPISFITAAVLFAWDRSFGRRQIAGGDTRVKDPSELTTAV